MITIGDSFAIATTNGIETPFCLMFDVRLCAQSWNSRPARQASYSHLRL